MVGIVLGIVPLATVVMRMTVGELRMGVYPTLPRAVHLVADEGAEVIMVEDGVGAGGDAPDGVVGVQLQGCGCGRPIQMPLAVVVRIVVGAHGVAEHQHPRRRRRR